MPLLRREKAGFVMGTAKRSLWGSLDYRDGGGGRSSFPVNRNLGSGAFSRENAHDFSRER